MYTPKEWKNIERLKQHLRRLSSFVCLFVFNCKEMFSEYLKIDYKSPSSPSFFFTRRATALRGAGWLARAVGVFEKEHFWGVKKKIHLNAASGYESVNGRPYASLLLKEKKKAVPRCEVPPHSSFPVVRFVTTFSF